MYHSKKIYPIYFLVDTFLITLIFALCYILRYNYLELSSSRYFLFPNLREYTFIFVLWYIFLVMSLKRRGLYLSDRSVTIPREILKVTFSVLSTSILIGAVVFFAQFNFFSRAIYVGSTIFLCIFLSGWRAIKRLLLRELIAQGYYNINVLIVGAGQVGKLVLEEVKKNRNFGFKVVGFLDNQAQEEIKNIPVVGKILDFHVVVRKYFVDEVIITTFHDREAINHLMVEAKRFNVGIRVVPENLEEPLELLEINFLGILPLMTYKVKKRHPTELALKRFFDFVLALVLLIFLSPVFFIIAILIKLDSNGPFFFRQQRVGLKGQLFWLYKFRSMVENAEYLKKNLLEKNEVPDKIMFKIKRDPRVTRVGSFLRRFSLDELPQLINIIKGDMSFVGPRPPTLEEVNQYNHIHMERLFIRPGITGLSQVRGRSDLTFQRWVKWDIWYANNWSFGLDFRILLWTIPAVVRGRGAY